MRETLLKLPKQVMKKNIFSLFLALLILWNSSTLINNENFLIRKTATNQIGRNIIQQTYEHENYTKISSYDDNLKNFVAKDIQVKNDFLFIAAGIEGMIIFEITNSTSPVLVSQFYNGGSIQGISVVDDIAYLAAYDDGVQIVNISNMYKPEMIGKYSESYYFHQIYVDGNFAYAGYTSGTVGVGGIIILDLASKAKPFKIGQYLREHIGRIEEITLKENYAIIIGQASSAILDITDKTNPVELEGRLDYIYLHNSFLDGNILYIAADIYGVLIYDITDIEDSQLIARYQEGSNPMDVYVENNVAYVVSKNLGLILLDVTDPANPTMLSNDNRGSSKTLVWVKNDYAFVTETTEFLQVYDVSDNLLPELVYNMSTSGFSEEIANNGDYVFVADEHGGVEIINTTNKLFPERVAVYSEPNSSICDVVYWNDTLFLVDEKYGLIIVNITDISFPQKIVNWTNGGEPRKIAYADNYLYLIDYLEGVEIINITDIKNPNLVFTYSKSGVTDIVLENTTAFISIEDSGFDILNVTSKVSPIILKSYSDTGPAKSLTVDNNRLYIADGLNGLEVYNITDKINPKKLATGLTMDYAESVYVNDSLVLIAGDIYGLIFVLDNGGSYEVLEIYTETGEPQAIFVKEDLIYIADGSQNFQIIGKDSENDGLADIAEEYYGTNPLLADSDADGLSDKVEVSLYRTNPLSNDTDNDLMGDYFEIYNSLNPNDANDAINDLDDDDLTNLEEFQHFTNPRDADTDDDFLTDGEEVNTYFTDPRIPDTDGDGWMDSWEIYYGTNPLDPLDYPDFETTPPFTEPPPTNPYSKEFKYYYLVIAVGSIVVVAGVLYLIIRFRGRRSLI